MDPTPLLDITPITLNGWVRMRMTWPVGSTSGPKSVSETPLPSTATLAAELTSCCVKNDPYFTGQLRISGQSTSVPSTDVDQFWFPATTVPRVVAPAATYWTPGTSRSAAASSGISVFDVPWPPRTPPWVKLPA